MKKLSIALLACLMVLTMAACGRNNDPMSNTTGSMPTILPTMDTNIPDPDTNGGTDNPTWNTEPSDFGANNTTGSVSQDNK